MKLLIHLSYLGTHYCGYQVQANGDSIQGRLNEAAEALFGYPCDIVGCSRTDSGVHANHFCASVTKHGESDLLTDIPIDRIPQAFSAHLPDDIRVFDAEWVASDFHARYGVVEKEYLYRIYNHRVMNPFEIDRAYHFPKEIDAAAFERMQTAAQSFLGTHDFSAFMAQGSKVTDTVRTVTKSEFSREENLILYRIAANGFLYNMVRIIVGTLLDVALGKIEPNEIPRIIKSLDRKQAGSTAPACGLYLNRVVYPFSK